MSAPSNPLFTTFIAMLIDTLTAMVPGSDDGTVETRRGIARLIFDTYQPRDVIEAMAAARAVAAHHAAMDNYSRAARPGVSDATADRLRATALAAARSVDAIMRARDKRREQQAAAAAKAPAPQPAVNSPEPPRQPIVRPEPAPPSSRPDYRASTALTSTHRLEPLAASSP